MNGRTKLGAGRKLLLFYASVIGAALLMAASTIDTAKAEGVLPPKCEGGSPEAGCFKEIRVVNNTNKKIWVVIQASIIVQPALSKPLNTNGEDPATELGQILSWETPGCRGR